MAVSTYLESKQKVVDSGRPVGDVWERARQTKTVGERLFSVLLDMAGTRERCMYCNDSRGTDIEHFRPKARFPSQAFLWKNMLLACTGCNRKKDDQFPVDSAGESLLIDPSVEDPWKFLDFVPATGELTPRWQNDIGTFDPKGEATTDPAILPLNIEAVTVGRRRTFRHLCEAAEQFLEEIQAGYEQCSVRARMLQVMQEHSDYGLDRWIVLHGGAEETPFSLIAKDYSEEWRWLRDSVSNVSDA